MALDAQSVGILPWLYGNAVVLNLTAARVVWIQDQPVLGIIIIMMISDVIRSSRTRPMPRRFKHPFRIISWKMILQVWIAQMASLVMLFIWERIGIYISCHPRFNIRKGLVSISVVIVVLISVPDFFGLSGMVLLGIVCIPVPGSSTYPHRVYNFKDLGWLF